jgi:type IV pilus assembly protein PilA
MKHPAFTLVEIIFVIVIIGVLSAVAVPKFKGLLSNSKISAELATASSVQSALDAVHSEWITNTCSFTWGNDQNSSLLNPQGYPTSLDNTAVFDRIFKTKTTDWETFDCGSGKICYKGPASKNGSNVPVTPKKPNEGEYWEYNATNGTFTLIGS